MTRTETQTSERGRPPGAAAKAEPPVNRRRRLESVDYVALANFRRALRQFLAFSDAVTQAAGVTAQQYQAILAIKARPDAALSIKDLAEALILQHHGAVQLADRLEAAGLARRRPSAIDRRAVQLELTDKGETFIAELAANHVEELLKHRPLLARTLDQLRAIAP